MSKKFIFTMQNILEIRETIKKTKRNNLAIALHVLKEKEFQLQAIIKKISQALILSAEITKLSRASYFMQQEVHLMKLRQIREINEEEVEKAKDNVESAKMEFKMASIELEKVIKSKERELEKWKINEAREEQKLNDEISNSLSFLEVASGSN